jgi:class 3 adenylate cyclase
MLYSSDLSHQGNPKFWSCTSPLELTNLLYKSVLDKLRNGNVETEMFECVTVFCSDICNYTVLASRTGTRDMLLTLSQLWINYDSIAKKRSIRKVETIGDAYVGAYFVSSNPVI